GSTPNSRAGNARSTLLLPSPICPHIGRMPTSNFPNLTVLDHPLIQHKLSLLRDRHTSTRDFKQLLSEIAMLMAYEVTKELPPEPGASGFSAWSPRPKGWGGCWNSIPRCPSSPPPWIGSSIRKATFCPVSATPATGFSVPAPLSSRRRRGGDRM